MKRVSLLLALTFGACGAASAATLDINLSDSALRGEFGAPLPSLRGQFALGVLTAKHDHRISQGHATLLVTGDAGAREANVLAGVGARVLVLAGKDRPGNDVQGGALGLGGMFEARIPAFNRLGGTAYAYWAPKVASFGDLNGHLEYALDVDYQILREASLYAGYRQLRIRSDRDRFNGDNGFHIGVKLQF
ncbi:MAG TPA: YfaZ family outer membrane protein [Candidatus Binatia bacterium]|nr:YfaZ family outer membrane protein [Candidatus Binatia bacterium]